MGLLDDAIREHLELKRQHGADPEEVSRQEQEALGAPRKGEFAKPDAEPGEEAEAPAAEEPQEPLEPTDEHEPFDVEALGAPSAPPAEPEPERAAEPEPEPGAEADTVEPEPEPGAEADTVEPPPDPAAEEAGYDEDPWLADERDEVPAGESLDRPRTDEPESGEDVLEETPDYLQETPEHDRLWFEQRPPRDFDWDK
jgi:hypothetical protein